MFHFKINDERFESSEGRVTVGQLLRMAGLPTEHVVLMRMATGETWDNPDAAVELRDGDRFKTRRRHDPPPSTRIRYTVNGEPQITDQTPLTVERILRRAGTDAAIDVDDLESYYLDNVHTGVRYESLSDEVPVADGDQFLALHAGRTPVALARA